MCTHVNTSEFIPALISKIAEKREAEGGSNAFHIPESVLWKVAKEIENRYWSNVLLTRSSLDDLVEYLRGQYGNNFIEYDLRQEGIRPLVLKKGVGEKYRRAMAGYFFNSEAIWYKCLSAIVDENITFAEEGEVQYKEGKAPADEEKLTEQNRMAVA